MSQLPQCEEAKRGKRIQNSSGHPFWKPLNVVSSSRFNHHHHHHCRHRPRVEEHRCGGYLQRRFIVYPIHQRGRERERERDFMSERCCWARSHLTHTHSLSLHNADNFGSFAGMLDQQFASFHKSLHRKEEEEEEEIRYVLERVQTSPGLALLFSILRQN